MGRLYHVLVAVCEGDKVACPRVVGKQAEELFARLEEEEVRAEAGVPATVARRWRRACARAWKGGCAWALGGVGAPSLPLLPLGYKIFVAMRPNPRLGVFEEHDVRVGVKGAPVLRQESDEPVRYGLHRGRVGSVHVIEL